MNCLNFPPFFKKNLIGSSDLTVIGIDVPEDNDEEDGLSVLSMDKLLRETKGVYLVHFLEIRQEKKHRR